jgi:hypothetical protein
MMHDDVSRCDHPELGGASVWLPGDSGNGRVMKKNSYNVEFLQFNFVILLQICPVLRVVLLIFTCFKFKYLYLTLFLNSFVYIILVVFLPS